MRRWSCWTPRRRPLSKIGIGTSAFSAAIPWLYYLFEVDAAIQFLLPLL